MSRLHYSNKLPVLRRQNGVANSCDAVDVVIGPAQNLAKLWRERNGENVGAIVSTLPMRLFSKKLIYLVMKNSLNVLDDAACSFSLNPAVGGFEVPVLRPASTIGCVMWEP